MPARGWNGRPLGNDGPAPDTSFLSHRALGQGRRVIMKPIQVTKGGRRRFIPQMQELEERWCPAFGFAQTANVLTITGDQYANNVTLFDNGQGTVSAQMS